MDAQTARGAEVTTTPGGVEPASLAADSGAGSSSPSVNVGVPDVSADWYRAVTDLAADRMTRRLAKEEGLLLGPSSGANVHAAVEVAKRMKPGQRVVTILCDGGERYLC